MALPPVRCVLRIAGPLVAHSYAAGEPYAAVDDQELAVCAIVQASKVIPGQLVVELQVAAGAAGGSEERGIHSA